VSFQPCRGRASVPRTRWRRGGPMRDPWASP
jgi:hypothetical protein